MSLSPIKCDIASILAPFQIPQTTTVSHFNTNLTMFMGSSFRTDSTVWNFQRSSWQSEPVQKHSVDVCVDKTQKHLLNHNKYIRDKFNVHGSVHRNNILVYNSNYMKKLQSLFYLITVLHVPCVTISHLHSNQIQLFHDSSRQQYGVTVTRCCSYSCFVLLKMGESDARNM